MFRLRQKCEIPRFFPVQNYYFFSNHNAICNMLYNTLSYSKPNLRKINNLRNIHTLKSTFRNVSKITNETFLFAYIEIYL